MKHLTFVLVVALGLCAGAAPRACAQATDQQCANRAANHYIAAQNLAATIYHTVKAGSQNQTDAQIAYWDLNDAVINAQNASYYFSIGNFGFAYAALADAVSEADAAGNELNAIQTRNTTVLGDISAADNDITVGDNWADSAP